MDSKESLTFVNLSKKWYNKEMIALRTLNNLRVPWIRDSVNKNDKISYSFPLRNVNILDIGCGGGILSEPLARLGANVTGIDTVKENIDFAKDRLVNKLSKNDQYKINNQIEYLNIDAESLLMSDKSNFYDVVIASEVLEHVFEWPKLIEQVSQFLKPNGLFFATTINRTYLSSLFAIQLAEKWIVPSGTHDWNKFIQPKELYRELKKNNIHVTMSQGMTLNPLTLNWKWINSTLVNYAMEGSKIP